MDDNTYYHKVTRLIVLGFLGLAAILATCQTVQHKTRVESPGYRYHQVEVRIDDDNGAKDSMTIKGAGDVD